MSVALSGVEAGETAVAQRVQQLRALIETTDVLASGGTLAPAESGSDGSGAAATTSATSSDFASMLQAATDADDTGETTAYAAATNASEASAGEGADAGSYEALIEQAAARNGVEPAILHGLIEQESDFDPSATSSAGAEGLTQLMPSTASSMGVADPLDPAESIEGGARYLGQLTREFGGDTVDALAAYNAGPGAVQQYGGVPPYAETQSYVQNVLGYAETYRQSHQPQAVPS